MKVLIIEDEPLASEKLQRYLKKSSLHVEVLANFTSLKECVPWIMEHQHEVDLFFMDIQLQDGLSFEIFSRVKVFRPVIFTTAFDEYAIDAFKVNSIDYLLKPISFTALNRALEKYGNLKAQYVNSDLLKPLISRIQEKGYKTRFLVKKGQHIRSILTDEIAYFYAEGRDVFLVDKNGSRYIIEYKLEDLIDFLNASIFYRINRSLIVNITAIKDVIVYSNRRLKLQLEPVIEKEAIVARERVGAFKKWFEGM